MNNQYAPTAHQYAGLAGSQLAGQPRRDQATTLEELIGRLDSIDNQLEGLRNQLFAKMEKLRGEMPSQKELDPRNPAVPTPCMASGMLGQMEQKIRNAQATLDQIDLLMQDFNQRV